MPLGVMVTENGPKYAYRVIYTFLIHFMLHEIYKKSNILSKTRKFQSDSKLLSNRVAKHVVFLKTTVTLSVFRVQNTYQEPNPYTQKCIYTGLMLINYILQPCEDRVSTYMRHAEIKDLSPIIIIIIIIISLLAVNILSEDPLG